MEKTEKILKVVSYENHSDGKEERIIQWSIYSETTSLQWIKYQSHRQSV
jgi:hypothetical protein